MSGFETASGNVIFISQEKEQFVMNRDEAVRFGNISTFIQENVMGSDAEEDLTIELSTVRSAVLAKILEFARKFQELPMTPLEKPLTQPKTLRGNVQDWYVDFVSCSSEDPEEAFRKREFLFEVLLSADFLNLTPLMDLCCAAIACMVADFKTPQDLKEYFRLPFEIGLPDEEVVQEANQWVQELESRAIH